MSRRGNRDSRSEKLGQHGGRMSQRQRLKQTIKVAQKYQAMLGAANVKMLEQHAEIQAARHAAKWYSKRWIWTMVTLIVVVGVVAVALLAG